MGKRGPKKQPTALKLLKGTYRKDRANPAEWLPPTGELAEPTGLDGDALRLWREKVRHLTDAGVLTLIDGEVLEGWCRAVATARAADAVVAREGLTTPTREGVSTHPCVRISRTAWDAAARLGGLLGLDPSSRASLGVPGEPVPDDLVAAFLSGKVRLLKPLK